MIDFEGVDVVVEQDVDDGLVRRALGVVLAVPEARIVVVHDVSEYPKRDAADVVVVASQVGGQFAWILSIQTERRTVEFASALDAIQRFCDELGTRGLVPDETVNPYSVWLIARGQAPRQVGLVVDDCDEDRYVLMEV